MGSKVEIVEMTRERFDALTFSRRPLVTLFLQQKEWYSDKSEKVIATIALDKIDRDWSFVLLGRDENGLFRAIDTGINFKYIHQARRSMSRKIINLINSGQSVFSLDFCKFRRMAL